MSELLLSLCLGAFASDAVSTHYALRSGAREVLLTQSAFANYSLIAGQAAGTVYVLDRWAETHPKAARWVAIGVIIGRGAIAAHNLRVARRMR